MIVFALADVWANALVAAAFVVGVVAGGVGAIRVFKYALEYLRGEREN